MLGLILQERWQTWIQAIFRVDLIKEEEEYEFLSAVVILSKVSYLVAVYSTWIVS